MSDYLQRRKALRDKFFPPIANLVSASLVRAPILVTIYDAPIGPQLPPSAKKVASHRMIYSRPIGPNMIDMEEIAAPIYEHPSQDWVVRAYERGLLNRELSCPPHIKAYVCKALVECCVDFATVRSPSRIREAQLARRFISYWLSVHCGWSTPRIGELINKDHSTVVVAIRRYRQSMALERLAEASK